MSASDVHVGNIKMLTIDGDSDVNNTAILILLGVHDVDGDWNLGECRHLLHLKFGD